MCWALYLASDKELPAIPWDENFRGFNTQPLSGYECCVAARFSFPYVIYLGSHEGCGCGFMYDDNEDSLRAKTVESLARYLDRALAQGARLEMFLCWEGDQNAQAVARKRLAVKDFTAPEFPLAEREFAVVIA